ncbi:hypothetical protein GTS_36010 [Gandjariella thermophila]|uniref:DUF397 domain-containing protein n=1 Tax=Gandjariella thermophila TaxID=1931992 RepID=A0A4D4JBD0_9PSEU|nr:hypothetical protein GTS_36010 [Gandjariella thermophila]
MEFLAAQWRKSSRSTSSGADCVEVSHWGGGTAVRDSKRPSGGALLFGPSLWAAFLTAAKGGVFDLDTGAVDVQG